MTVDPSGGTADNPINIPGITPSPAPSGDNPAGTGNGQFWDTLVNAGKTVIKDTAIILIRGLGIPKFQQDFPDAARSLPMLRGQKLQRGYIAQDKNDPLVNGLPLGLQFLYNPTEWEQDYSLDTTRYPSNAAPQAGSALPTLGVPGASTVSFNLILDRTWDVNNPKAGAAYKKGIRVDIEQFEKMVGYTPQTPFVQAVSLRLVFSPTLSYYGFITNFAALYSQFTTDMRCYRGGLTGITLQILPDQPSSGPTSFSTIPDQAVGAASGSTDAGTGR